MAPKEPTIQERIYALANEQKNRLEKRGEALRYLALSLSSARRELDAAEEHLLTFLESDDLPQAE